jgi:hypothetical protein
MDQSYLSEQNETKGNILDIFRRNVNEVEWMQAVLTVLAHSPEYEIRLCRRRFKDEGS